MDLLSLVGQIAIVVLFFGGWPFYFFQRYGSRPHGFLITLGLSFATFYIGVVAMWNLGSGLAGAFQLLWAIVPYVLIVIHWRRKGRNPANPTR